MNHMLSNFESSQRERERAKKQYIKDLKTQVFEQLTRRKKQEQRRKEIDTIFEEKVKRQRQEMKQKYAARRSTHSKTPLLEPIQQNQKADNPQKESPPPQQLYRSYLFSSIHELSPLPGKDFSKSELYESRPRLGLQTNIHYVKAKKSLQQQKQKIVRFRVELRNKSKRRFVRMSNTALDDLKHLTIQLKTEPSEGTWMRDIKRAQRQPQQEKSQSWRQIIRMNKIEY